MYGTPCKEELINGVEGSIKQVVDIGASGF
jgi:hypothetical protein